MSSIRSGWTGTLALQTVVAVILALAVYIVVATVAGMFIFYANTYLTFIRPPVLEFFALIAGAIVGMIAAKAACDAVLKAYSARTVFVTFTVLSAVMVALELALQPHDREQFNAIGQMCAGLYGAYVSFWQNDESI